MRYNNNRNSELFRLRQTIRRIIKEEAENVIPGDASPDKQVHVFDFDDTLGETSNANGIMLHQDGKPVHKSEGEARDWAKSMGLTNSDFLPPEVAQISNRDGGYAIYVTSKALAKVQNLFKPSKTKQAITGVSEPPAKGPSILIDFTPSADVSIETTKPIDSTIDRLKDANSKGSKTIVITARQADGEGTNFKGEKVGATNAKDMNAFLSKQGAKPTDGVLGVVGQNKGDAIIDKYLKSGEPPEEIHFYDDLEKNTSEVEAAVGKQVPSELFVYGPGEFAHGQASADSPRAKFPKDEASEEDWKKRDTDRRAANKAARAAADAAAAAQAQNSSRFRDGAVMVERWQRLAGLIKD
jgi:hypothetical protein